MRERGHRCRAFAPVLLLAAVLLGGCGGSATYRTDYVYSVAFSPDGGRLAACVYEQRSYQPTTYDDYDLTDYPYTEVSGEVRLFDPGTGRQTGALGQRGERVYAVAFSPDGATLASACWDRTVELSDARTGRLLHVLEGHRDIVVSAAFSPDGATVASSGLRDHTVRLWDARTGALLRTI